MKDIPVIPNAKMPDIYPDDGNELVFVENIYHPTRLEYFAAAALQALLTSVSAKKHDIAVIEAVTIARSMEVVLDQKTS